ncbi:protein C9orf135 [Aplysia californica]|uniref:Protein C9orf135 n=1 Tax=Aplysia californica TaxID=6500 RepID=A0ABM0K3C5_APLCA|nr:protein C9orf135 [Aplysia californica]
MALHESDIMGNAITDDRKGSLTLRSDHMNYSRAILNSHWHQARQAEPKDYDINKDPIRTMTYSTYNRIGNVTDGSLPDTTYQEQANQVFLKPMYEDRDSHRGMVQMETLATANAGIDRNTGDPKDAYGSVLPFHNKDHKKFHLDTTYNADYIPPFPYTSKEEEEAQRKASLPPGFDPDDKSTAYRKMKSQFTDTTDYRRNGWNTWQDESGIYANSEYKSQVFPKTTTIPERMV